MMEHWELWICLAYVVFIPAYLITSVLCIWWTRYRQWRAVPKGYFGRVYGAQARENVRR